MRKIISIITNFSAFIRGMRRSHARLQLIRKKAPHIEIAQGSWATPRPQVHVAMRSASGTIGLYTYTDDDAGNAHASLNASTLANITGLPIVDRRPMNKNEARGDLLKRANAIWMPRDAATA